MFYGMSEEISTFQISSLFSQKESGILSSCTTVKHFLEDIKLGHYWHMFEEEDYDDLAFILAFGSKDIAQLLNTVGIHKQGHRKKFESSLKIRKSLFSTSKEAEKVHPQEKESVWKESELRFATTLE